ncbi:Gfo/Idh/MocA family oxidoreductase [Mesorhizobium sp. BAC0120]|uniref:Gfo/Idh/MocA family protein n=1 Tax=Mesorhizobium sp. BAC0120 TaxID=3090670 RepID=UPI00298D0795|nr:Gfo/Idh/MocA family oxidoreductase [Mesorhizobium sp. BAC0120]MDW6023317.1 Gfo/Idh/MocA family oxidoreductase [Mesorhizobium sp. BAC0120]
MIPVRFGIVSTAKIARDWVIPAMQAVPECEVVAITSRDEARAASVAAEFGISKHYGSLEQMLEDTEVEAVYIPTPNSSHVAEAIAAARAGRHVLCEKPIALTAAEAQKLVEVQRETGVQMSEAFMVRYHPRWLAAREIVRSGRLGRVTQIHATYSVLNDNPHDIRFNPELGGGALGDVGVYPITAARFLFEDEPFAATATFQKLDPAGVDVAVSGMLEFPNDRSLLFSGALLQAWAHWVMVIGTDGWMEIPVAVWPSAERESVIRLRRRVDLDDTDVEVLTFAPANQYEHEVREFARSVRGLIPQPWPIDNAVAGMRVLDAIRKSAATHSRVAVEKP